MEREHILSHDCENEIVKIITGKLSAVDVNVSIATTFRPKTSSKQYTVLPMVNKPPYVSRNCTVISCNCNLYTQIHTHTHTHTSSRVTVRNCIHIENTSVERRHKGTSRISVSMSENE